MKELQVHLLVVIAATSSLLSVTSVAAAQNDNNVTAAADRDGKGTSQHIYGFIKGCFIEEISTDRCQGSSKRSLTLPSGQIIRRIAKIPRFAPFKWHNTYKRYVTTLKISLPQVWGESSVRWFYLRAEAKQSLGPPSH